MSKEFDLIYALCEAMGFEVETTLDYQERKESYDNAIRINKGGYGGDRALASAGPYGKLVIDADGEYTSLLVTPIVDYKLIKRIK